MTWISVSERKPEPHHTVLVWHEEDLYPVTAFYAGSGYWLYESDGPEDMDNPPAHRFQELLRPPTHWMELPPT